MQSRPLLTLSVALAGNAAAHRFITPAGAPAGANANTLGVARTAGAGGDAVPVDVLGTTIVEAGAAFAAGTTLKVDAAGRAIAWATAGARVAVALQAAGAEGDRVEVLLIPNAA